MPNQNTEAQLIINALTQQRDTNANAAAGAMARIAYLEQELAQAQAKLEDALADSRGKSSAIEALKAKLAEAAAATPPVAG